MNPEFSVRPAVAEDMPAAYAVFQRSIYDYLFQLRMVHESEARNPPVAESWQSQANWIKHLWNTCAENWVAMDSTGNLIGWALSIERDAHLELAMFFVEPGAQSMGQGRALIEKAFRSDLADHRLIIATHDRSALSIYLRSGVHHLTTSVEFTLQPRVFDSHSDLAFERLDSSERSVDAIVSLEQGVLGFARETDIRFILADRPAWLALRRGTPVGYAFGVQPISHDVKDLVSACGPMVALNPADMPAIIDHVMGQAGHINKFTMIVPLMNHEAIAHLLKRGGKIEPFYLMILSDDPTLKLDRYIHTTPALIL